MPSPTIRLSQFSDEQSPSFAVQSPLRSVSGYCTTPSSHLNQSQTSNSASINHIFSRAPVVQDVDQPSCATLIKPTSSDFNKPNSEIDYSNPNNRIKSSISEDGTSRGSGDFQTLSNNSTETLASEYHIQDHSRKIHQISQERQLPLLVPSKGDQASEELMIGYGHITGSFILDSSLVNEDHFDQVKRKRVVGAQGGGGVVRAEKSERHSGIFGSLGWGSFGETLVGYLGSKELSSIQENKAINSQRSIPILSTPQAVLFVQLHLKPGESQSYIYRHPLPQGIPPTHRGRAMKTSYNLTIGTQRAVHNCLQDHVQLVDFPFRVLPGVNGKEYPLILINSSKFLKHKVKFYVMISCLRISFFMIRLQFRDIAKRISECLKIKTQFHWNATRIPQENSRITWGLFLVIPELVFYHRQREVQARANLVGENPTNTRKRLTLLCSRITSLRLDAVSAVLILHEAGILWL